MTVSKSAAVGLAVGSGGQARSGWSARLLPNRGYPVSTGRFRVGGPAGPGARVERGADVEQLEGDQVVDRRDAGAAVDGDLGAVEGHAGRRVERAELVGAAEPAVRAQVDAGRHVDGTGDVAGDRVDRLGLAAVALGRPRVDQHGYGEHPVRVDQRHRAGAWLEVALRHLGRAGLHLACRHPGRPAAVEEPDVRVPVVAEQPPAPARRAARPSRRRRPPAGRRTPRPAASRHRTPEGPAVGAGLPGRRGGRVARPGRRPGRRTPLRGRAPRRTRPGPAARPVR